MTQSYPATRAGIRRYVTDNSSSTVLETANAIGMDYKSCFHSVKRMIECDMLIARYDKGCLTLTIGRDPLADRQANAEASKAVAIQKQLARNEAAKRNRAEVVTQKRAAKANLGRMLQFGSSKRQQEDLSQHCTEQFITNDGDYEIIPVAWQQPLRYPRISLSYEPRSTRRGTSP